MKYRIIEHSLFDGRISYEIQKKSILGFWYNPENIDAYTTGFYSKLEDAQEAIRRMTFQTSKKIIEEIG